MPVFAKKLSPAWRKAFAEFEKNTGFEMMHQDDVDSGTMTPAEAWRANIDWLELHTLEMFQSATDIETPETYK